VDVAGVEHPAHLEAPEPRIGQDDRRGGVAVHPIHRPGERRIVEHQPAGLPGARRLRIEAADDVAPGARDELLARVEAHDGAAVRAPASGPDVDVAVQQGDAEAAAVQVDVEGRARGDHPPVAGRHYEGPVAVMRDVEPRPAADQRQVAAHRGIAHLQPRARVEQDARAVREPRGLELVRRRLEHLTAGRRAQDEAQHQPDRRQARGRSADSLPPAPAPGDAPSQRFADGAHGRIAVHLVEV
jgi:hypothetical protein